MFWTDWEDEDGDSGSARWGSATSEQIDQILAFATQLLGDPDTIA